MISYLITTHNEGEYVNKLFTQLQSSVGKDDEIVVVDDNSTDSDTIKYLLNWKSKLPNMVVYNHDLDNHFGNHKNYGKDRCTQPWIFQIDADELLGTHLLQNIPTLLEYNESVELINVPRINIVDGLTQEDIQKWGWNVNSNGWINFPDVQSRIFQNLPDIRWFGKVHERIVGFKSWTNLPFDEGWCIIHHKDISRQRKQNEMYAAGLL